MLFILIILISTKYSQTSHQLNGSSSNIILHYFYDRRRDYYYSICGDARMKITLQILLLRACLSDHIDLPWATLTFIILVLWMLSSSSVAILVIIWLQLISRSYDSQTFFPLIRFTSNSNCTTHLLFVHLKV